MNAPRPPADAERLIVAIDEYGWPGAHDWALRRGWNNEKIDLLMEYLVNQGFIQVDEEEAVDGVDNN